MALSRLCGHVGFSDECPPLLQDEWVRLPEVVEGADEASLDAGHVLLGEVGVVSVGVSGPGHSSAMRRAATM